MKKLIALIVIAMVAFTGSNLKAQQMSLYSHYNFDHFTFNPAAAGYHDAASINGMYRNMWAGLEGSPLTQFVNVHSPLKNDLWGLGGLFINDKAGAFGNNTLQLALRRSFGNLSAGLGLNLNRYGLDNGFNAQTGADPTLAGYQDGFWSFSINPGLYFDNESFYAGISVPQLFENQNSFADLSINPEFARRHIFGLIGMERSLNSTWDFNPSALIRATRGAPVNADIDAKFLYDEKFWLNLGYRTSNMLKAGVGFDFNERFKLGYMYDHHLGDIGANHARSSHEVFASARLAKRERDADKDGIPDNLDKCPDTPGKARYYGCPPPAPKPEPAPKPAPKPDTDGDGIIDENDNCPNVYGTMSDGCPEVKVVTPPPPPPPAPVIIDTDGDGIADGDDRCPNTYGVWENGGCPRVIVEPTPVIIDSDGDGIVDTDDRCPNTYGVYENGGCPQVVEYVLDRDNDGIVDSQDRCPDTWGVVENNGCPVAQAVDTDRDGVTDTYDQCPNQYGPASNNGCPTTTGGTYVQSEEVILQQAFENLLFETGSSVIKSSSYTSLDNLASLLLTQYSYQLRIAGHTDNVGNSSSNMALSKKRAESVRDYLNRKGVGYERMIVEYYGDTQPIYDNNTSEGRRKNRRVEFSLIR